MSKTGRPNKADAVAKREFMQFRATVAEKQTFRDAAALAGIDLSAWIRERLLRSARKELEEAGRKIPFLEATIKS